MSKNAKQFLTPVMRMVGGHPMTKIEKDMQGNPLKVKNGPNAGQPTQEYVLLGAIRKDDPGLSAFWATLTQAAREGHATLFDAQGNCTFGGFSFKMTDGDSTTNGPNSLPGTATPNQRPGYPGHFVFRFKSSFRPKVFYAGHYAPHEELSDAQANLLQRGYYVRVSGSAEGNNNPQKPGIYLNLSMVEIAAVGEVINSGPDAAATFGGNAIQALPAGAQALPGMAAPMGNAPAGLPSPMPGSVPPAAGFSMPGAAPAATMAPPVNMPGMAVQPHPGILAGPGMSSPPAMPGQPVPVGNALPGAAAVAVPGMNVPAMNPGGMPSTPMPATAGFASGAMTSPSSPMPMPGVPMAQPVPVRQMTAAAGQWTYDQLIAAGHTDATLKAQGLML